MNKLLRFLKNCLTCSRSLPSGANLIEEGACKADAKLSGHNGKSLFGPSVLSEMKHQNLFMHFVTSEVKEFKTNQKHPSV